jgi:hypothetical protein
VKWWDEWNNRHPIPLDQDRTFARRTPAKPGKGPVKPDAEELTYVSPYDTCEPIPQQTLTGEEPRYLAEIWWQIGNYAFDQIDQAGGPYNLNRAVSAYENSLKYKKPPIYGVSLYKRAWSYFKQQRYRTAVVEFVNLLRYADEQEAKTGDPGADFRAEAYTYIAWWSRGSPFSQSIPSAAPKAPPSTASSKATGTNAGRLASGRPPELIG